MRAFRAGQAAAFGQLMARHRAPVFNFIARMLKERALAEDVLQETWLKVARHTTPYDPRGKFKLWLYTLARNACLDALRRSGRAVVSSLDAPLSAHTDDTRLSALPDADAPLPDDAAAAAQVRPMLERALQTLPAEQREVFVLREMQGLSFPDIGAVTGTNENTAKSRMRYALEALRKSLVQQGYPAPVAARTVA